MNDDKLPEQELSARLAQAAMQVTVGGTYTHYKNMQYKVIGLALLEATSEVCVMYQAQYGAHLTFIRPLSNWLGSVQWEGKTLKRFTVA